MKIKTRSANTDGLINCLRQPGQLHYQPLKSMVFNLSQLIKSCGTRTDPAAETESIGLPGYAQLSQVFAEPSGSFTVTPNSAPSTGIHPSTGIIPSGSFTVTQDSQPLTGIIPSGQLCLDTETFSHLPGLYLDQKLPAVYRDFAKTHANPSML
jgi:hypothetical protein